MTLPVFLSFPQPANADQDAFVKRVCSDLADRGLAPRTLGVNEYDSEVPLRAVRRMLLESNGIITIALRRYLVASGEMRRGGETREIRETWFTSPWPHMETAMAYQMGLPILALREHGVHTDGVFERGTIDLRVHEVDTTQADAFLTSQQWRQPLSAWERHVRTVALNRGTPPQLY